METEEVRKKIEDAKAYLEDYRSIDRTSKKTRGFIIHDNDEVETIPTKKKKESWLRIVS